MYEIKTGDEVVVVATADELSVVGADPELVGKVGVVEWCSRVDNIRLAVPGFTQRTYVQRKHIEKL